MFNSATTRKILVGVLVAGLFVCAGAASSTGPEVSAVSPDKAMQNLKEGNERFVSGKSSHPRMDAARVIETSKNGQHPFATILTCSDSRVPAELIFDQGIGDIFIVRVAGNVCSTDEAGTIEYGAGHLGAPLLVVLGHTGCGAVTAVATGAEVGGNIAPLVANIKPAVVKASAANPHLSGADLVPEAIKANCWQSIESLFKSSEETRELVKSGKLKVVAAIYNISTGKVGWLGEHPDQAKLLGSAKEVSEKKESAKESAKESPKESPKKASGAEAEKSSKESQAADKKETKEAPKTPAKESSGSEKSETKAESTH
jgi:carbonic anhydrase